jgi:hypothetical protein
VDGALGNEIDSTPEDLGEFILQPVDREAKRTPRCHHIEQIDVTRRGCYSSSDGSEDCELGDPVPLSDIRKACRVNGKLLDYVERDSRHGVILPPGDRNTEPVVESTTTGGRRGTRTPDIFLVREAL